MIDFGPLVAGVRLYGERVGIWAISVLLVVIAPLIPLGIEAVKDPNYDIKSESILLTAAVMAVGFALTSESNFFRVVYVGSFGLAVTLDYRAPGLKPALTASLFASSANWLFVHPVSILAVVLSAQAAERLVWHVIQDRLFPDWLDNTSAENDRGR